jgi:hypothetical protein
MQFSQTCGCCADNKIVYDKQKDRRTRSSVTYYQRNREQIILRTLRRYYERQNALRAENKKLV